MKGKCSVQECGVKDGLACELGYIEMDKCPHFTKIEDEGTEGLVSFDKVVGQRLPWTGRALGLNDIMLVSARSASNLVGLIGPFNAGKTAFLTSLFANLAKSGMIEDHLFAGSYTMDAWARLKQYTEWPESTAQHFRRTHRTLAGEFRVFCI